MKVKLFQNRPSENEEAFKRELLETNYQRVFYTLRVLMPISLIMWGVSFAIRDTAVIQRANFFLFASSVVLFVMSFKYPVGRSYEEHGAKMVIVNFTYLALLIWGTTLFGFHEDNTILLLDMILVIIVMAFMLLAEYQVLIGFYVGHIAYLFVATPYLADGFDYPPKVITPILLVSTMLFLSRIIYRQHMERFILGEKLKMKQEDLKAELLLTLEKLQTTEQNIRTDIIKTLVKVLEYYDLYTRGHSENVSNLAVKIADKMGFPESAQDEIMVCGLVHDIGKILIPVDILNKPGKLESAEYEVIKKHSQFGCDMLMESTHLHRIGRIVLHHHEQWDGNGYPHGIKHEAIPIESQILMVADTWDAMTSERIYKKAKTPMEAKAELIALSGKQFSPKVVHAFLELIKEETIYGYDFQSGDEKAF